MLRAEYLEIRLEILVVIFLILEWIIITEMISQRGLAG